MMYLLLPAESYLYLRNSGILLSSCASKIASLPLISVSLILRAYIPCNRDRITHLLLIEKHTINNLLLNTCREFSSEESSHINHIIIFRKILNTCEMNIDRYLFASNKSTYKLNLSFNCIYFIPCPSRVT